MRRYDRGIDWPAPAPSSGADLELHTPTRPAGFISDLVVPVAQALVTGFILSGLVTFVLSRTDYNGELGPLFWGLALMISAVCWLWILIDTRKLLRTIEKLTGLDLDRDGFAGEPNHGPRILEVHVREGSQTRIIESERLGIDDDRLIAFSVGIANGRGLSESTYKGSALFPGGINEFRAFRSKLLDAGLIEWINPKAPAQGLKPTGSGRAFFRRVAALGAELEDE